MNVKKTINVFFTLVVGGFIAIIVGAFMIRGTMHLWDNKNNPKNETRVKDTRNKEDNSKDN